MTNKLVIQRRILDWYQQHGRKNLPWQINRDPYHVWISEIMLQQTQVTTVIPYYERFMQRFSHMNLLAHANIDTVLQLWAGLGYYARARNLHRAAQMIVLKHDGLLPNNLESLQNLPGIGRSTAGAILSLGYNLPATILDGNVKRVLSRWHLVSGQPNHSNTQKTLWGFAEAYTPVKRNAQYTQAMMDLGATICTRSNPKCIQCPLQSVCKAHQAGKETAYPEKKSRKQRPTRQAYFLIIQDNQQRILLERRPPTGIWGGLWCTPTCDIETNINHWCQTHFSTSPDSATHLAVLKHTFSHYHLDIQPVLIKITPNKNGVIEHKNQCWYTSQELPTLGLPKPIKSLLCPSESGKLDRDGYTGSSLRIY